MRGSLTRAQIANTHPRRECKVKPPFIFIISLRQPSNSISVSANTKPISINNVLFSSEHSIFSHMRDQMPLAFSRQAYKEALPMFFFFFARAPCHAGPPYAVATTRYIGLEANVMKIQLSLLGAEVLRRQVGGCVENMIPRLNCPLSICNHKHLVQGCALQ